MKPPTTKKRSPSPATAGSQSTQAPAASEPAREKTPMKRTKGAKQILRAPKIQPGRAAGGRCSVSAARALGGDSAPPSKSRQSKQEQFLLRTLMANIPEHVYFKDRDSDRKSVV